VPIENEYDIEIRLIIDKAQAEVSKFAGLLNNVSKNTSLEPLVNQFNQLKASVTSAGQALKNVQQQAFYAGQKQMTTGTPAATTQAQGMFQASINAAQGVKTLGGALSNVNTQFNTTKATMANFQAQGKQFSGLLDEWWHRFGSVAIAFTIVYRAMNALEAGIGQLAGMIKKAIVISGELVAEQAKLAVYASLASKGAISISEGFDQASGQMIALHDASVTSLSTLDDLIVGLDKLGQANIFPRPEQMKNFADFIDLMVLVSKTTGNTAMQIRSEMQGLLTGQMRQQNVLVNMLHTIGILTDEDVANLKKMTNRLEIIDRILTLVGKNWEEVLKKITMASPEMAMSVWEKGIVRVMTRVIQMVSQKEGVSNIFGQVIYEHLTKWNEQFKDLVHSEDAKAMGVMMMKLRDALDMALTAFENIVPWVAKLFVAFSNAEGPILAVLKAFLMYEAIKFLVGRINAICIGIKALGDAFMWASGPLGPYIGAIAGLGLAFVVLHAAIKALIETGYLQQFKEWAEGFDVVKNMEKFALFVADLISKMDKKMADWAQQTKALGIRAPGMESFAVPSMTPPNAGVTYGLGYNTVTGAAAGLGNQVKGSLDKSKTFVELFVRDVNRDFGSVWDALIAPFKKFFEYVSGVKLDWAAITGGKGITGKDQKKAAEDSLETLIKLAGNLNTTFEAMAKSGVKDATVSMAQFQTILKGLRLEIGAKFDEIKVRRDAIQQLLEKTDDELRKKGITKVQLRMELIGLDQQEDDLKRLRDQATATTTVYDGLWAAMKNPIKITEKSQYELQKDFNLLLEQTADDVTKIQDKYVQGTQDYNNAMRDLLANVLPQFKAFTFVDPDYTKAQDTITKKYRQMANDARIWTGAVAEGFKEVQDVKVFDALRDIVVNAFKGMTDAIVDFVDTGKVNFHDMAVSMLKDLLRLEIQLEVMKPLANWMGGVWGSIFPSAERHASGGIIEEHIIGYGKSGKRYEFGEQGPEAITPLGSSIQSSAPVEVHIHNAPQGTSVQESTTSRGGKRIDVIIDQIVSRKLAGGSMSQSTLRSMYGLRPALVGR
jgi:hypothetical protein